MCTCDAIKQNESEVGSNLILIFLIDSMYLQSYLYKTPLKLVNWFQIYRQLNGCKNNRKHRNYLLCLAISWKNQYLRVMTHSACSLHTSYSHVLNGGVTWGISPQIIFFPRSLPPPPKKKNTNVLNFNQI